jgi:hypothetical protein
MSLFRSIMTTYQRLSCVELTKCRVDVNFIAKRYLKVSFVRRAAFSRKFARSQWIGYF